VLLNWVTYNSILQKNGYILIIELSESPQNPDICMVVSCIYIYINLWLELDD
jgi:hypothetical protein